MKKFIVSSLGAGLVALALAATALAADPTPSPSPGTQLRDRDMIPTLLGLTHEQVQELRHDGLSLAQIAERQKVDPQVLIDALTARWTERIEVRLANGAITADQAATLRAQVEVQARNAVYKTTLGGMHGAAVGAGPNGAGNGMGYGMGNGAGNGAGPMNGNRMSNGMGNGAARGAGNGTGTCDGTGPHGQGQR